jgi:hypothetical protein
MMAAQKATISTCKEDRTEKPRGEERRREM